MDSQELETMLGARHEQK